MCLVLLRVGIIIFILFNNFGVGFLGFNGGWWVEFLIRCNSKIVVVGNCSINMIKKKVLGIILDF